jgi:hypothetical protein
MMTGQGKFELVAAKADGWTVGGFWITFVCAVLTAVDLSFAVAIFLWTRKDDDERHGELLDALAMRRRRSRTSSLERGRRPRISHA